MLSCHFSPLEDTPERTSRHHWLCRRLLCLNTRQKLFCMIRREQSELQVPPERPHKGWPTPVELFKSHNPFPPKHTKMRQLNFQWSLFISAEWHPTLLTCRHLSEKYVTRTCQARTQTHTYRKTAAGLQFPASYFLYTNANVSFPTRLSSRVLFYILNNTRPPCAKRLQSSLPQNNVIKDLDPRLAKESLRSGWKQLG